MLWLTPSQEALPPGATPLEWSYHQTRWISPSWVVTMSSSSSHQLCQHQCKHPQQNISPCISPACFTPCRKVYPQNYPCSQPTARLSIPSGPQYCPLIIEGCRGNRGHDKWPCQKSLLLIYSVSLMDCWGESNSSHGSESIAGHHCYVQNLWRSTSISFSYCRGNSFSNSLYLFEVFTKGLQELPQGYQILGFKWCRRAGLDGLATIRPLLLYYHWTTTSFSLIHLGHHDIKWCISVLVPQS